MGLEEVVLLRKSPWPPAKLSGFAKQGKAFEKAIAQALPSAMHNPWFQFKDANGPGCCSPDILLPIPQGILCIEVKLTYCEEAQRQLSLLYLPILRKFFARPVAGLVIVKSLGQGYAGPKPIHSLSQVFGGSAPWPCLLAPFGNRAHLKAQLSLAP